MNVRRYFFLSALAATLLIILGSHLASALFTANKSVSQSATSSATLQPPTSLAGTGGCQALILGPKVTLTWTITSSNFATGYSLHRSTANGGPYTFITNISGRATATFVDTTVSGLNTTYYYVLKSTFANWTSANGNQATATTPIICL